MKCPYCSKENPVGTIKCQCGYQFQGYAESNERKATNNPPSKPWNNIIADKGFWSFDQMISIRIIPIAFRITIICNLIAGIFWSVGIYNIVKETTNEASGFIVAFLAYVMINLVLFILTRLLFETLIVIFKIWENTSFLRIGPPTSWKL
jgi:hypothetical protein